MYWGIYTRNVFWTNIVKCDFSYTPELLAKQEEEMYNAVSELQNKVLLFAYFIFQDVNSSQGFTILHPVHIYLQPKSLLLPFFCYSRLLLTTKMIVNLN